MKKKSLLILASVMIALLLIRAAMPYGVQWYVNNTIDKLENYSGSVGDIDLMLWRGAYEIENISIVKSNGKVEQPLFAADEVQLSLLWSELIHGAAVGEALLINPTINIVDSESAQTEQFGKEENWLRFPKELFPLKIDRLRVVNGAMVFHNSDAEPEIHVALEKITLELRDLVTHSELSEDLPTTLEAEGTMIPEGRVAIQASFNADREKPTFDFNFTAKEFSLPSFTNLFSYYAPFDLEAGKLDMAIELASDNGQLTGYVKPVLHDVEVFTWKGDIERDNDGLFGGLIELLFGGIAELFENQPRDQLATKIPIEGTIDDPQNNTVQAALNLLKNAFIDAFDADLENNVILKD